MTPADCRARSIICALMKLHSRFIRDLNKTPGHMNLIKSWGTKEKLDLSCLEQKFTNLVSKWRLHRCLIARRHDLPDPTDVRAPLLAGEAARGGGEEQRGSSSPHRRAQALPKPARDSLQTGAPQVPHCALLALLSWAARAARATRVTVRNSAAETGPRGHPSSRIHEGFDCANCFRRPLQPPHVWRPT